jgi:hypothetical protein
MKLSKLIPAAMLAGLLYGGAAATAGEHKPNKPEQTIEQKVETPKFDPANIISDSEFTDKNYLEQHQIQLFLEHYNSCLAKPYKGKLPSQMIYDACQKHAINPMLLIVNLQKEKSLVSRKTATDKQLEYALGFGATDSGKISKYAGFENQVENAARRLRELYDAAQKQVAQNKPLTKTVNYGTKIITLTNAATKALFDYTPHINDTKASGYSGGNYLFWQLNVKYTPVAEDTRTVVKCSCSH